MFCFTSNKWVMSEIYVEKFGGASVNSAAAVRNVISILQSQKRKRIVVISAMGKTTNALERVVNLWHKAKAVNEEELLSLRNYHLSIVRELFQDHKAKADCGDLVESLLRECRQKMLSLNPKDYDFLYDSIVSYGERLSTSIISAYMNSVGFLHDFVSAQDYIITDNRFRAASIRRQQTEERIFTLCQTAFQTRDTVLTQGFIGSTKEGYTTTLGREGSDFSAAVFAYCSNAQSMTIWKDVEGVMNADPKRIADTCKLEYIPYHEAIELSYYGASIIHPKTIKPLENKNIPLYVKSFLFPQGKGSVISNCEFVVPFVPNYIFKDNQTLLSLSSKDLSFIAEDNISTIFSTLSSFGIRVNLMQNSALSFSVCFDGNDNLLPDLVESLKENYNVRYNENLTLMTIRHYGEHDLDALMSNPAYHIIIVQQSRTTMQCLFERKASL